MTSVKIERNGESAEVDSRFLADFIKDGWVEVSTEKTDDQRAEELKEQQEKEEKERQEQEAALGRRELEKEEANRAALARIEAENREKEERDQEELRRAQEDAIRQANKLHLAKTEALEDKDQIEEYVKEKFGVDLDKRGSLETVKEKAKAVVNESSRVD